MGMMFNLSCNLHNLHGPMTIWHDGAHLPQKAGLAAAALLDMTIEGVVADVCAAALKKGREHLPLPPVKVVPNVVLPPLQSTTPING